VTRVDRVAGASRREEIARMLAGDRTGELSLQHAQELLDRLGTPAADAGRADRPRRSAASPRAAEGKDGRQ